MVKWFNEVSDANGEAIFMILLQVIFLHLFKKSTRHNIKSKSIRTGDDHFNTVLYTGDGNATQNITGVGFMPDWTWLKEKSSSSGNVLADSSRGYEKILTSHTYNAESTGILNNNGTRTNDGFQTTNSGASNENGQTYVALELESKWWYKNNCFNR